MIQHAMPQASPEQAEEWERLLILAEEMADYEEMEPEIEAAAQQLELHRAEFNVLMEDEYAASERAHRLLAESPFQHLRYTAADVHRAFEAVGYPRRVDTSSPENREIFLASRPISPTIH